MAGLEEGVASVRYETDVAADDTCLTIGKKKN